MSQFRDLFAANFSLTDLQRAAVRAFIKKWGILLGAIVLVALVVVGLQDPSPESGKAFDIAQKASFGVMRLILASVGLFFGAFLGYVVYQLVESSKAGSHTTRIDGSDSEPVRAAKLLNRGLLLALLVALGGVVVALALSGAGGR